MEFALIRHKITKNQRTETEKTLQDSKDTENARHLKERQDNLSMFMGGYSASNHADEDEDGNKKNTKDQL